MSRDRWIVAATAGLATLFTLAPPASGLINLE